MKTRLETAVLTEARTAYRTWNESGSFDPAAVATSLAADRLFDHCVLYERDGVWWYAGGVLCGITVYHDRVAVRYGDRQTNRPVTGPTLRVVADLVDTFPVLDWRAYGWLAFEAGSGRAAAPTGRRPGSGPLAQLVVPSVEMRISADGIEARGVTEADVARALLAARRPAAQSLVDRRRSGQLRTPVDTDTADADTYRAVVATAVGRIRAGQLSKIVLSRRVAVPFDVDLAATCLLGRRSNTPARTFLVDLPGTQATGFSPETVVEVTAAGDVLTRPLAGTRALGLGAERDAAARAELFDDPKEVFEHAMSVRVAVDELQTVCLPDSVAVQEFMTVEPRGSVQHLGSKVGGRLRPDASSWDALAALFPAVTASGVPKAVACQQIAEIEGSDRGLYAGAVVQVGQDGSLDAALALRCVFNRAGRSWLQAGAGVVAGSRPDREYTETREKFASIAPHLVARRR